MSLTSCICSKYYRGHSEILAEGKGSLRTVFLKDISELDVNGNLINKKRNIIRIFSKNTN